MRILHISPSFAPAYRYGGTIQALLGLTKGLIERDAEVRILTTDCDGPHRLNVPSTWTSFESIPVRYVHSWTNRDFAPGLLRTPRSELAWPDIVHVTGLFCSTSMWGIAAGLSAGKPVVLSPHGTLEEGSLAQQTQRKLLWLKASRSLLNRVDVFHTTSPKETASVRRALASLGLHNVNVMCVPNGIFTRDYHVAEDAIPPRVIALGRVHPSKGHLELLRAIVLLAKQGVFSELHIAGPREDEAYAQALEREAAAAGLGERFRLIGYVDGQAKTNFLREARVLALPSRDTENFGIVVLEALASGVPVVASRTAPWEMLESEGCGRWVDRSPESLAAALRPYLEDAALAAREGLRGKAMVERLYDWSEVARQMIDEYGRIL